MALFKKAKAVAPDVRLDVVWWAVWAARYQKFNHNWHYAQVRPFPYNIYGQINTDCSGFIGWCFKQAGAPDPYQRKFNGTGNTETLISLGKKLIVPRLQVRPGDVVVYNVNKNVAFQHTALVVEGGADPLTISMGQEGDPRYCRVSQDGRPATFYRFPTTQAWPARPKPPMP